MRLTVKTADSIDTKPRLSADEKPPTHVVVTPDGDVATWAQSLDDAIIFASGFTDGWNACKNSIGRAGFTVDPSAY